MYRQSEGALIQIPTDQLMVYDDVDPIDHIEKLAISAGLKHSRVGRTVTVCVVDEVELVKWKLLEPVVPYQEYLGYP